MKYKLAIIGLGNIGILYDKDDFNNDLKYLSHSKVVMNSKHFKLVGGVDTNERRGIFFTKLTGCDSYDSIKSLKADIDDIDIFVIASSTNTHLKILNEIIQDYSPKVVLCEKPLSYNLVESIKIIEICQKNKIELFINLPRRIEHSVGVMKKLIQTPKYFKGTVWYSNGAINNGIHFIDIITYLFGSSKKIDLISKNHEYVERKDFDADFKLSYDNGEIYFISWPEELYSNYKIEIYTDSCRLVYDNNGFKSKFNKVVDDPLYNGYKYISTKDKFIDNNLELALRDVYKDILNFLNEGKKKSILNDTENMRNIHYIIDQLNLKIHE